MPKAKRPRFGSMGVWPRKRAKRSYPRIRSWASISNPSFLGFAGYKAGMTHVIATDNRKHSLTKGQEISIPATILECPPLRILQVRFYQDSYTGPKVAKQFFFKTEPELKRKMILPKKHSTAQELDKINTADYTDIRIVVYTQPKSTGLKKKPEVFELALGGKIADKLAFVKQHIDKEITVKEVFQEGNLVDAHAVSRGKGIQGPVKRFGVGFRQHKSEKGVRSVGSLGGWSAQGHVMYRVAHAGQMGYHQRVQYNLQVLKISEKGEEINVKGGWPHYGTVRSHYVVIKGSLPGAKKRLVLITQAIRPQKEAPLPTIEHISLQSKQGR